MAKKAAVQSLTQDVGILSGIFTVRHDMAFGTTSASLTSFDSYCNTSIDQSSSPHNIFMFTLTYRHLKAPIRLPENQVLGLVDNSSVSCRGTWKVWHNSIGSPELPHSVRVKATTCSGSPRDCVFHCYSLIRDHYLLLSICRINLLLRYLDLSWRMLKRTSICTVQWGISAQYL